MTASGTDAIGSPLELTTRSVNCGEPCSRLTQTEPSYFVPRVDEETPLPDPGAAALDVEAHALLPVLELDVRDLDAAALRERLPVRLEVLALETRAANLFGEQPVLHRMVDVLEEVAVDPLVDRSRDPVRIDQQDGDSGSARRRGVARTGGLDTTTDGATAAVAAIELMRKWRLFIGKSIFSSRSTSACVRRPVLFVM